MSKSQLEILALLGKIEEAKLEHAGWLNRRNYLFEQDPENEEYEKYDEDLVELEDDIETLKNRVARLLDTFTLTGDWSN